MSVRLATASAPGLVISIDVPGATRACAACSAASAAGLAVEVRRGRARLGQQQRARAGAVEPHAVDAARGARGHERAQIESVSPVGSCSSVRFSSGAALP
jgi:hypothetical protein